MNMLSKVVANLASAVKSSATVPATATHVAATIAVSLILYVTLTRIFPIYSERRVLRAKVESELSNWVDDESLVVIEAICDALIPCSHDVTTESAVDKLLLSLRDNDVSFGVSDDKCGISPVLDHMSRGSSQSLVHHNVCRAMFGALLDEDKIKIILLVKLLGTRVGCLLLTWYPVPFQVSWCIFSNFPHFAALVTRHS
jgi:hypothetical protein